MKKSSLSNFEKHKLVVTRQLVGPTRPMQNSNELLDDIGSLLKKESVSKALYRSEVV
jgi:hypothetical protein